MSFVSIFLAVVVVRVHQIQINCHEIDAICDTEAEISILPRNKVSNLAIAPTQIEFWAWGHSYNPFWALQSVMSIFSYL